MTQTSGHFKLGFSAMRLQSVTDSVSLHADSNGQVASKNLAVSEKMKLGGMYGVRADPVCEAYGGLEIYADARSPDAAALRLSSFTLHTSVIAGRTAIKKCRSNTAPA